MKSIPWAALIVFLWIAGIGLVAGYLIIQIVVGFLAGLGNA